MFLFLNSLFKNSRFLYFHDVNTTCRACVRVCACVRVPMYMYFVNIRCLYTFVYIYKCVHELNTCNIIILDKLFNYMYMYLLMSIDVTMLIIWYSVCACVWIIIIVRVHVCVG